MTTDPARPTDDLSVRFAALSDPTRRAILERLRQGETTVGVLARPFDMSLAAVSRHLKVLERAGFISRVRVAQHRPARLDPNAFADVAEWLDRYRRRPASPGTTDRPARHDDGRDGRQA